MKRPDYINRCGPYLCKSRADGSIEITAAGPQYPVWNAEDGGGPSISGRIALAHYLERWLNSVYSPDELAEGQRRISQHERQLILAEMEPTTDLAAENAHLREELDALEKQYVRQNVKLGNAEYEAGRLHTVLEQIVEEGIVENERSRNNYRCYWCGSGGKDRLLEHLADCPVAIAQTALKGE